MKPTDLLKSRDKLRKYDELKEWKEKFSSDKVELCYDTELTVVVGVALGQVPRVEAYAVIPDNIREIIVNALEAEIQKLDEE